MDAEDVELIRLYESGRTINSIAKDHPLGASTIANRLKKNGVTIRSRSDSTRLGCGATVDSLKDLDIDKIVSLYEAGQDSVEIGRLFNVHAATIRNYLKDKGVTLRDNGTRTRMRTGVYLNEECFDDITPESAYWLGFLAADGCIYGNYTVVALANKDVEHLKKLRSFVGSNCKLYRGATSGTTQIRIGSKRIVEVLTDKYGFTPNKTFTYEVPEALTSNVDFWRGAVDGDGWISNNKHKNKRGEVKWLSATVGLCGNRNVVESFKSFVESHTNHTYSVGSDRKIFRYSVYGDRAIAVLSLLYNPEDAYFLDRKMQRALELTNRPCIK